MLRELKRDETFFYVFPLAHWNEGPLKTILGFISLDIALFDPPRIIREGFNKSKFSRKGSPFAFDTVYLKGSTELFDQSVRNGEV